MAGGPISWRSKTQSTVALSSAQAEYQALCAACQEAIHLRLLSSELDTSLSASTPITIFEDNTAAIAMSQNPVNHEKTKHIFVKYHFIRECVSNKHVKITYVSTKRMIADLLTKPTNHYTISLLGP
jgi:arginyl-tRNA--protein-N-Asp/Glu arginylyltransferase